MNTFSKFFKINPGIIYKLEHLIETPIEKFLFGKTRYDSHNPLFRCMGSRLLWINDLLHYFYFGLQIKCNVWNQKEWNDFAIKHNEQLYDIMHCDTYSDMCNLCEDEFKKPEYDVKQFIKFYITMSKKPTKKDLKRWLLH